MNQLPVIALSPSGMDYGCPNVEGIDRSVLNQTTFSLFCHSELPMILRPSIGRLSAIL